MIQRIQSFYLFLVFLCLGAMIFIPIAQVGEYEFTINGVSSGDSSSLLEAWLTFPLSYLVYGLLTLTLVVVLSFKDRKRQLLLGRLNYILILVLVVLIYLSIDKLKEQLGNDTITEFEISTYLPIVALGFHLLANKAIKKDEELVRSMDRIR